MRRLIITPSDLRRLRSIFARPEPVLGGVSERVSTLMDARERARRRVEPTAAQSTISALKARRDAARESEEAPVEAPVTANQPRYRRRQNPVTVSDTILEETDEPNIGARLLQRRKRDEDAHDHD